MAASSPSLKRSGGSGSGCASPTVWRAADHATAQASRTSSAAYPWPSSTDGRGMPAACQSGEPLGAALVGLLAREDRGAGHDGEGHLRVHLEHGHRRARAQPGVDLDDLVAQREGLRSDALADESAVDRVGREPGVGGVGRSGERGEDRGRLARAAPCVRAHPPGESCCRASRSGCRCRRRRCPATRAPSTRARRSSARRRRGAGGRRARARRRPSLPCRRRRPAPAA